MIFIDTPGIHKPKNKLGEFMVNSASSTFSEVDVIVMVCDATDKSFSRIDENIIESLKETYYIIGLYELNTMDTLLLFTDKGNYIFIPVYDLPDLKWKELGKHISNLIPLNAEERIVSSMILDSKNTNVIINRFIHVYLNTKFSIKKKPQSGAKNWLINKVF